MTKNTLACDDPHSLHEKTLELFTHRPRTMTLEIIEAETKIPLYWLQKFSRFDSPGVNRVQALYEYLSDAPLSL